MSNQKSISVIIPNFCGKKLLEKYLPTVQVALSCSKKVSASEIILVDDASTDDSVFFIQSSYPEIILLKNDINSGFSITINKGIFAAKYQLVLLLNSDMQLAPDFFDKLCPIFDKTTDIFGVSPKILDERGKKVLEAQRIPKLAFGVLQCKDNTMQEALSHSLYLSGGCALVDRQKLLSLGGFDTTYSPFYFEDFDLSLRAWKRGWISYYAPNTYGLHCHSITIRGHFSKNYIQEVAYRNKLIISYLHTEGLHRFSFWLNVFLKYLIAQVLPSKSKKIYRNAVSSISKIYPQLNQKRKEEKRIRKYSLREVFSIYF